MSTCVKCGKAVSLGSRDLITGECKECRILRKQEEQQQRVERERQRRVDRQEQLAAMELKIINGQRVHCPICGNDRFSKQHTLMNTRGAALMNMDWADAGAETCICKSCGYVLWFRENR